MAKVKDINDYRRKKEIESAVPNNGLLPTPEQMQIVIDAAKLIPGGRDILKGIHRNIRKYLDNTKKNE